MTMAVMTLRMAMTDPLLTLHQMFSPAFPVGAFAYSHGLEAAVQEGRVTEASQLQAWLQVVLSRGAGWSDAVVVAQVAQGAAVGAISELVRAMCPSPGRRLETDQQGAAFVAAANGVWGLDLHPAPYPVAVGQAIRALDLPVSDAIVVYLQAFASNLTSAGVRLVPLGQTEGQQILQAVSPLCRRLADKAVVSDEGDIGGFAPLVDIDSLRQATLYSKLFRS